MSKGAGTGQQSVVDYNLSIDYAVCHGPVDKVLQIYIGDKSIGIAPMIVNDGFVDVSKPELFGGPKKGGGVTGRIFWRLGGPNQVTPAYIAGKMTRTSATMTAYRGMLTLFFGGINSVLGFNWGSNNPVVPSMAVKVQRSPKTPLGGLAMFGNECNPAHMIYELLTEPTFGIGYTDDQMDYDQFMAASSVLQHELFGLSYIWMTSTPVDQFVNEILSTIGATLVFNMLDGKWGLKLLRDDYDLGDLKQINPSNATLKSFQRKGWGETINEVIVTWTNPINEAEETVTAHDNANISIQGQIISDSKNYPGIRNSALALTVAERDLRQSSAPLASAEVVVDRSLWDTKPGDVIYFLWPDRQVTTPLIMRVLKTEYGRKGEPGLKLSLLEDIFSFGTTGSQPPDEVVVPVGQEPVDVPFWYIDSLPYYLEAITFGDTAAQSTAYPEAHTWLLAASRLTDIRDIDVLTEAPLLGGGTGYVDATTVDEAGHFQLGVVFAREPQTLYTPPDGETRNIILGSFLLIVDPANQDNQELCLVVGVTGSQLTLRRGVLDTTPQVWGSGSTVWAVYGSTRMVDRRDRVIAENPNFKFLPITSLGRLAPASATVHTRTLSSRMYLPYRPANMTIDGVGITGAPAKPASLVSLTVAWANRNRITETAVIQAWDAGNVAPEVGQTTTMWIYNGATLINAFTGLTGTSRVVTKAELGNPTAGQTRQVYIASVRDGFTSRVNAVLNVSFT